MGAVLLAGGLASWAQCSKPLWLCVSPRWYRVPGAAGGTRERGACLRANQVPLADAHQLGRVGSFHPKNLHGLGT